MREINLKAVTKEDVKKFIELCASGSIFFSNSQAYIDTYVNGNGKALCYNDGSVIFFLSDFGKGIFIFCCPRGKGWEKKLTSIIWRIKKTMGDKINLAWIWETDKPIRSNFLCQFNKSIRKIKNERFIQGLKDYYDLDLFLRKNGKLRKKFNYFYNYANKKFGKTEVLLSPILKNNYDDAELVLNIWKKNKDELTVKNKDSSITTEHVFRKNSRIIKAVIQYPALYESLIIYCNGTPRGFAVAFRIAKTKNLSACAYAATKEIPNSGEVTYLFLFNFLAKKGYELLNWGNSYNMSLANFKKQFLPIGKEISYDYIIKL